MQQFRCVIWLHGVIALDPGQNQKKIRSFQMLPKTQKAQMRQTQKRKKKKKKGVHPKRQQREKVPERKGTGSMTRSSAKVKPVEIDWPVDDGTDCLLLAFSMADCKDGPHFVNHQGPSNMPSLSNASLRKIEYTLITQTRRVNRVSSAGRGKNKKNVHKQTNT